MTLNARNINLKVVYCPSCHLATRADRERCLHCGVVSRATARNSGSPKRATGHTHHASEPGAGR